MRTITLMFAAIVALAGFAHAQTLVDIGAANPTPGPSDIYQLSTNGNTAAHSPAGKPDGLNYYTDNAAPPGQTFTTTGTSTNLTSVAIRTAGLDSGGGYGTPGTTPTYYLRLYTVSGSTATLFQSYTFANPGFTDGDWLKCNNLAVPLSPYTTYAYSFGIKPSSGGWCALAVATNAYSGGEIALITTNGGSMTLGSSHSYDGVFVLGMTASAPTANTPNVAPKSTVYVGQRVTLTESALGATPLFYQWQTDGGSGGSLTNIPGATATNATVTVSSTGTINYDVIVTNSYGSATSSVVAVTVLPPVSVTVNVSNTMATMPPQGLGVCSAVYDGSLLDPQVAPMLSAVGITAIRTPGGSYADVYDWENNSGIDGAYVNSADSFNNLMNYDVIPAGAKAIVTVNYGSNPANNAGGDTNVAAAWVAYANVTNDWDVKYWEIGNEVNGNGYFGTTLDWEYDLHFLDQTPADRVGQPALSPAAYGSNAVSFIQAMKSKDPTISCGVTFMPGNDSPFNTPLLNAVGTNADFVIIHWYPGPDTASVLAASAGIPAIVTNTLQELNNTVGATHAAQMKITVTETGAASGTIGAPVSLFAADNYLTWLENGIVNVDYQILHNDMLTATDTAGHAYYGAMMAHLLANVGDTFLQTTSAQSDLRVHAATRQDGSTGVMLVNLDPLLTIPATVTINNGPTLANTGIKYQFGTADFIGTNDYPSYPPSSNSVPDLGSSFTVSVPPYTIVDMIIPQAGTNNTPPVLAPINNLTVNVGAYAAFIASATDTDSPPQTLTFSLASAPNGATVNSNTGAFYWRPTVTNANTVNPISLVVTDDGIPSMSATQSFTVTVNPLTLPTLSSITFTNRQFAFWVNGETGPDYAVQVSTNLINWNTVFINYSASMPFQWTTNTATLPAQFYRIQVGPPLP
ncbi:MAG: putative Ig domain-containing protein [Verrucomicrobiia bacterium]